MKIRMRDAFRRIRLSFARKSTGEDFSGRGDFLNHNNMFISLRHDPVPYELYRMQAMSYDFNRV